jgi:hypothetical protein
MLVGWFNGIQCPASLVKPYHMDFDRQGEKCLEQGPTGTARRVATVLLVIWSIAGLLAIIDSLFCMGRSGGDVSQKVSGAIIAFLFGPIYWIYKHFMRKEDGYCTSRQTDEYRSR